MALTNSAWLLCIMWAQRQSHYPNQHCGNSCCRAQVVKCTDLRALLHLHKTLHWKCKYLYVHAFSSFSLYSKCPLSFSVISRWENMTKYRKNKLINYFFFLFLSTENHHKKCIWSAFDWLHGWYSQTKGFRAHQLQGMCNWLFHSSFWLSKSLWTDLNIWMKHHDK